MDLTWCIQWLHPLVDGKLVDNFSHELDVTSLQDPFTSRPYKTPFYFYYCVPRKIPRDILFQIHVEYSPSSRLLVSAHCSLRHRVEAYVSLVVNGLPFLHVRTRHFFLEILMWCVCKYEREQIYV